MKVRNEFSEPGEAAEQRCVCRSESFGLLPFCFTIPVDWPNLPPKVSWSGWFLMGDCEDVQI